MHRVNCSILDVSTAWRNGANFSLQLSSRTRFDKVNKKKVVAENQCEKHKKIEFRAVLLLEFSMPHWSRLIQLN